MAVDMTARGGVGIAGRIEREELPHGVCDMWLIELISPHVVELAGRDFQNLVLSICDMDALPKGGYPRPRNTTHAVSMGVITREFKAEWFRGGQRPTVAPVDRWYAAIHLGDEAGAVHMAGRVIAGCIVQGELPLQAPSAMFQAVARTAARAANLVTVIRPQTRLVGVTSNEH
jgi:hypothetical protein